MRASLMKNSRNNHSGAEASPKGPAVRRLKRDRSLSTAGAGDLRGVVPSTKGPGRTNL